VRPAGLRANIEERWRLTRTVFDTKWLRCACACGLHWSGDCADSC